MAKIVTLGEIMLRLSPQGNDRFIQSESFRIIPGGGEANVAISLANYGHEAYFVSKLPKHEIGQIAVNALRRYGVDTRFVARGGDRVGLYYAETGASMRPSKVIYDRAHSAIAEAAPADFDFDAIMEGADWFHWSGITPAISDKAAELTRLPCNHPGLYAGLLRQLGFRQHDAVSILRAAADRDRLSPKGGIQKHLDAGIETVHVAVENRTLPHLPRLLGLLCEAYVKFPNRKCQGRICVLIGNVFVDKRVFYLV